MFVLTYLMGMSWSIPTLSTSPSEHNTPAKRKRDGGREGRGREGGKMGRRRYICTSNNTKSAPYYIHSEAIPQLCTKTAAEWRHIFPANSPSSLFQVLLKSPSPHGRSVPEKPDEFRSSPGLLSGSSNSLWFPPPHDRPRCPMVSLHKGKGLRCESAKCGVWDME